MQPQFVDRPAFTLAGMKLRVAPGSPAIPELWRDFDQRMGEIANLINPAACYGAMDNVDHDTGQFDYLAAVQVGQDGDMPAGMESWQVPAQTYAVFACTLPTIGPTFDQIYGVWLPQSGYQRAAGPEFEYYDEAFDPNDPQSQFTIYIPVTRG